MFGECFAPIKSALTSALLSAKKCTWTTRVLTFFLLFFFITTGPEEEWKPKINNYASTLEQPDSVERMRVLSLIVPSVGSVAGPKKMQYGTWHEQSAW